MYREARRMALKRVYPDLEMKLSELLAKMPRPLSASSTPVHSDQEESDSDTEAQEEHEVGFSSLFAFECISLVRIWPGTRPDRALPLR
jgi:hypothetical protein